MKIKKIAMKKTNWKVTIKVSMAGATAIAGVIGGQAMTF
ncbi:smalltalk protein [Bacteroides sp.]